VIELIGAGYNVVVLDNLVNSKVESLNRVKKIVGKDIPFEKVDLKDAPAVEKVFQKYHVSTFGHSISSIFLD
jgi:UDP-glucose 4-epimerase